MVMHHEYYLNWYTPTNRNRNNCLQMTWLVLYLDYDAMDYLMKNWLYTHFLTHQLIGCGDIYSIAIRPTVLLDNKRTLCFVLCGVMKYIVCNAQHSNTSLIKFQFNTYKAWRHHDAKIIELIQKIHKLFGKFFGIARLKAFASVRSFPDLRVGNISSQI